MSYFEIEGINWSSLKYARESMLLYKHMLSHKRVDTAALALGRVTHTLVFEPAKFQREYAIWEDGDRRGNAWKAFRDAHPDQTIFKPGEIDIAVQMAEAVRRHPLVQPYLDGGIFEQAVTWTDPESGLLCKARPDWLVPDDRVLLDLKTCVSADGRRFGSAAARLGYHTQIAHYRNGVEHGLKWKPRKVAIVAVEKEPPHDVSVFAVSGDDLHMASIEVADLLNRVRACRESNTWPGRYETEQALQLPSYITGEVEFDYE